jgi:hypothetical protein
MVALKLIISPYNMVWAVQKLYIFPNNQIIQHNPQLYANLMLLSFYGISENLKNQNNKRKIIKKCTRNRKKQKIMNRQCSAQFPRRMRKNKSLENGNLETMWNRMEQK